MAPPRASRNFEQRQPITTTLRTICQSYASNTCLRELLQNADDAKASEIEFVLDTTDYTHLRPFLHDGLAEYGGPALLARNDSVFSERDFRSLSSVGDSCKRNDPASIGKFGQGFNSVYHWTDGPQLYSRDTLLLLDPHYSWSQDTDKPGGPAWDVVTNHDSIEVQNHLQTFGAFTFDPSQPIPETLIRIPLRTDSQAKISKINDSAPSVEELEQIVRQFCQEVEDGALLFLKNVRKIIVRVDQAVLFRAQIAVDNAAEMEKRDAVSREFQKLFAASDNIENDVQLDFETTFLFENPQGSRKESFLIQHYMMSTSGDSFLDAWTRSWKLFPWVAVAAPIGHHQHFVGRLFSTLGLPTKTGQPVHIHGLFSIAPDRARLILTGLDDTWNKMLFEKVVPKAWALALEQRNPLSPTTEKFSLWPFVSNKNSNDLWACLDEFVIDETLSRKSHVWNAMTGRCVKFEDGYLEVDAPRSRQLASALAQVQVPCVLLTSDLFDKVKRRAKSQKLTTNLLEPALIRQFLRNKNLSAPQEALSLVLEFSISDADLKSTGSHKAQVYRDMKNVNLWPTLTDTLAPPDDLFLPRDFEEMQLFRGSCASKTVDIAKLSEKVRFQLRKDISFLEGRIRHRTLRDLFHDIPTVYPPPQSLDLSLTYVNRMVKNDDILRKIWEWISMYGAPALNDLSHLAELWIVPLRGSTLRQLMPRHYSVPVLVIQEGDSLSELLSNIGSIASKNSVMIVDNMICSKKALDMLFSGPRLKLQLATQKDLLSLLCWLVSTKSIAANVLSNQRTKLLKYFSSSIRAHSATGGPLTELANLMRQLPIFSTTTCKIPYEVRETIVGRLENAGAVYELPHNLPPLPNIAGLCLCDMTDSNERQVLNDLHIVTSHSDEHLIKMYFIPWMKSSRGEQFEPQKYALANWILEKSRQPSNSWKSNILSEPIIPLAAQNQSASIIYECFPKLVDPESPYRDIYFPDEGVFPDEAFYNRHKNAFKACNVADGVSPDTPLHRARLFASRRKDLVDLPEKMERLLTMPIQGDSINEESVCQIRDLVWIPGLSPLGEQTLLSPAFCRSGEQSYLVDLVWGKTSFSNVRQDWKRLLGWDQEIPAAVILQQLDLCVQSGDKWKVDGVLEYISTRSFDSERLCSRRIVLGSCGSFFLPKDVFGPGHTLRSHSLVPHMDRIDTHFFECHKDLLEKLGIQPEPSLNRLLEIQAQCLAQVRDILTDDQLHFSISLLEVAVRISSKPDELSKLMVPDASSKLRLLTDIVCGDRDVSGEMAKFNFTHPALSEALVRRLRIENCFEAAMRLEIEINDHDDDEYEPKEDLCTTITDTLSRYPVDASFNEYLANADDANASSISWILDQSGPVYPTKSLLTKDLAQFQGSSLLVHNDGIFEQKDFEGFKKIGQGGKTNDALSTGMFGRGALCMYHFTDVPMLVSAGFFIILDPQRRYLSRNRHHVRKAGIILPLSTVRRIAPDQLAPFHEINGFDADSDYYEGTIFRFPLRGFGGHSDLTDESEFLTASMISDLFAKYLQVAQSSLLFLYNVERIEYSLQGKESSEWCVSAQKLGVIEDVFRKTFITLEGDQIREHRKKEWYVGMQDLESSPAGIVNPGKSRSKITECGTAVCLQSEILTQSVWQNDLEQAKHHSHKVFCKLPTTTRSTLPISFHATFAITGDRRSIPFAENDQFAKWNQWLLTDSIAELYIKFAQELALQIGVGVFEFWPARPQFTTDRDLSDVVARSFWNHITSAVHITDKLLPCITHSASGEQANVNNLKRSTPRKSRKLHPVTSAQNACFDFLPEKHSLILRPLIALLQLNLVRPEFRLRSSFQSTENPVELTYISAQWASKTFRDEQNCLVLEKFLRALDYQRKAEALSSLFELFTSGPSASVQKTLNMLDGCRILPRPGLEAPLGMLRIVQGDRDHAECHLLPTEEEKELFSFARELMVHSPLESIKSQSASYLDGGDLKPQNMLAGVIHGAFNIRTLGAEDVGRLVNFSSCPLNLDGIDIVTRAEWSQTFWKYLNSNFQPLMSGPIGVLWEKTGLYQTKILVSEGQGQQRIITPHEFSSGPYIVSPSNPKQLEMCSNIPGLHVAKYSCLPASLKTETDLNSTASFLRLLSALEKISKSRGSMKSLLRDHLCTDHLDLLGQCVINYLSDCFVNGQPVSGPAIIRSLPVWLRVTRSDKKSLPKYIAAESARLCEHSALLPSFLKNLDNFISPKTVKTYSNLFKKLNLNPKSDTVMWHLIQEQLPPKLSSEALRKEYVNVVKKLKDYQEDVVSLPVVDGNGNTCQAKSLYDHEEEIFRAAFCKEAATHFVHPDFRRFRHRWIEGGLKTRTQSSGRTLRAEDYLECALAIGRLSASASHQEFEQAAQVVSEYLCFENPDFKSWPSQTWEQISKIPMFMTTHDFTSQPQHRLSGMAQVINNETHCSLLEAGQISDQRLTWSQMKFLQRPPALIVFNLRPQGGRPQVATVINHLRYLTEIHSDVEEEDLAEFLEDVKACYGYLQDQSHEAVWFPQVKDLALWFNLPSTSADSLRKGDLTRSLLPATRICLNAPDDVGNVQVARNFLIPYEKLLTALGCQSVVLPMAPSPPSDSDGVTPLEARNDRLIYFREHGKLCDVTFEAESQTITAHRNILAAASEYCESQFSQHWNNLLETDAIIHLEELSFKTLSSLIDFAYTGTFDFPEIVVGTSADEVADVLDDMLDLLAGSDRWLMPRLHQMIEFFILAPGHIENFILVPNVTPVMKRAEEGRANALVEYCEAYLHKNFKFVQDHESKSRNACTGDE